MNVAMLPQDKLCGSCQVQFGLSERANVTFRQRLPENSSKSGENQHVHVRCDFRAVHDFRRDRAIIEPSVCALGTQAL
jgi:hypothetical protein